MTKETNEEWRYIPGFEGLYKVSNKGEVKSLNYNHTGKEKILKPIKDSKGYFIVNLYKENKMKSMKLHRLVAEAFLTNPLNLPQINHKNEIKEDNRVENLEYCDSRYNTNFGTRNERVSKANINNPKCSKKVLCIESGVIYPSTKEIQRQLGFSHSQISCCCNKKYGYKTVKGFHFEWAE